MIEGAKNCDGQSQDGCQVLGADAGKEGCGGIHE
jgi:hypothetical protein